MRGLPDVERGTAAPVRGSQSCWIAVRLCVLSVEHDYLRTKKFYAPKSAEYGSRYTATEQFRTGGQRLVALVR